MPNQLNKNKNKLKEKNEIRTAHGDLILAQQAERRRRFQKIAADERRSAEALLEETRQWVELVEDARVELVEDAREEFLNWCSPREENRLARLEVPKEQERGVNSSSAIHFRKEQIRLTETLLHQIAQLSGYQVSIGIPSVSVGIPSVNVGMAGPKEKLPKFDGDEVADPIQHCKTCETIWRANGVTDTNEWLRQFPATLWGVTIDWFTGTDPQKLSNWDDIKKEFFAEFQLLRDDNAIVAEIFNTKQGKNETVRVFARRLKDLINKMENKPADGLQKRWFIEGLQPKLWKKMKIMPPSTYTEAYNRAMNLESEQKTKKRKKNTSSDSDNNTPSKQESSDDEGSSKKVRALQKDMIRMMEFKNMNKETKGNELWCTKCKKEGHTKGSCPKDQFCEICQIMGHSIKECPFNLKTRTPQQVFLTQEASASRGSGNTDTEGATLGGYRNNRHGQNNSNNNSGNNNNGGRSRIQYDANGRPII